MWKMIPNYIVYADIKHRLKKVVFQYSLNAKLFFM